MKKILFVAYGGGHINIIDLIARQLLKEKNIEFKILALTTAYNKVVDKYPQGIVKKISDYENIFQDDIEKIKKYGLELLEENYNTNSGISKDDTIMYLGCSMNDLINKHGQKKANELYVSKKRQSFLPIETMKKILKYENIDIVVSTTSPRFEQASFIAGNELGLETLEILDLFGELYPLPKANHIVCMNKDIKISLIDQGLRDREYHFLGQPAIEKTVDNILNLDSKTIKKQLSLKNNLTLLYATQIPIICNEDFSFHSYAGYDVINNNIFNIFKKLNSQFSINIILRIHPNEDIKNYRKWLDKYPFVKCINDKLNLEESISVCDVLLNQASTVSIEAIAAKKDVFTFKYYLDKTFPLPAVMKEPFMFSDGFKELEYNLCKYLNNPIKRENIDDFMPKDATKNIAKLIKEL
jgi:hypothetical protein